MTQTTAPMKRSLLKIPTRQGLWARLSRIGETLGWEWLIYNPGIFKSFQQAAQKNAPKLAAAALAEFPGAKSIVDVGCGTGGFAAEFQNRGLRVVGFEYSRRGRNWAIRQGIDARPFDVSVSDRAELAGERFDLVLSTEVAEHVPPFLADAFVRFIASCSDTVLFTAAQPGGYVRGNGHVNEQVPAYWIAKFEALGYRFNAERTQRMAAAQQAAGASYYMYENLIVMEKSPARVEVRPLGTVAATR